MGNDKLVKPTWNRGSEHVWDLVIRLSEENKNFTKTDTIMFAYLMKNLLRAGKKPYPDTDMIESKLIDLEKAREYLTAWIDHLSELIESTTPIDIESVCQDILDGKFGANYVSVINNLNAKGIYYTEHKLLQDLMDHIDWRRFIL